MFVFTFTMHMFELQNAQIGYLQDFILIDNVCLKVVQGNVCIITGDNGIGKTALIKTIVGLIPEMGGKRIISRGIEFGYLNSESINLFPYMKGREIIEFFESANSSKVYEEVYQLKLMQKILTCRYEEMSSGMKQMLKICLTLTQNKKCIVWDEPFRGLAISHRQEVLNVVRALSHKLAFVITDHQEKDWDKNQNDVFFIGNKKLEQLK